MTNGNGKDRNQGDKRNIQESVEKLRELAPQKPNPKPAEKPEKDNK